ncbi:murein transglycosylase A [Acaryochloris marina]|uniref:peptidoglycan lytic exotransglycosylase n=1 Tax=Acaryochloris marina (strain MBIC 11017) TaxID=329726 RepID=B0BZ21_ACAM1|nr:MltA domain-containing protein [Acaryochloris marina]ABW28321.1 membrane-bound lytic transglycosylase A, putative [Acaryochloris marina MBIC11017]
MFFLTLPLLLGCTAATTPLTAATPPVDPLPLKVVSTDQLPKGLAKDQQLWNKVNGQKGDYKALLTAIDHSLEYLGTDKAQKDYQDYKVPGITRDRVSRSLRRFRQLVVQAKSPQALETAVKKEFQFYQSIGNDQKGNVDFTGYYEATYPASRQPTTEFRYPLYQAPADLKAWPKPHPTRAELEGADGLQASQGPLKGLELVWLRDRIQAFLVQVQGSARLGLTDGTEMTVGYAGKTAHPYTSIGKALIADGKFTLEELSLPVVLQYFEENPQDLDLYIPKNKSFVFFQETFGSPPMGNLNVPVTDERSIATDKSLMPPGALALIQTNLPYYNASQTLEFKDVSRFVLDHDTGSAIKGPGRVDIFMGTGAKAKERAGVMTGSGQLYYLLLKDN